MRVILSGLDVMTLSHMSLILRGRRVKVDLAPGTFGGKTYYSLTRPTYWPRINGKQAGIFSVRCDTDCDLESNGLITSTSKASPTHFSPLTTPLPSNKLGKMSEMWQT